MLLTIDPGVHAWGVGLFTGQTLGAATYLRAKAGLPNLLAEAVDLQQQLLDWTSHRVGPFAGLDVLIEFPCNYPPDKRGGRASKVDPNDLINLGASAYVAATSVSGLNVTSYSRVFPRDWKGTMDGDAMVEKIRGRLSPHEHACLDLGVPKSLAHNMIDAVGLGLWRLGRLERVRVFPGATPG